MTARETEAVSKIGCSHCNPREVEKQGSIGKVLYRLTSLFEGSKDIDKTMERLAIQNAMSQPEPQKKA